MKPKRERGQRRSRTTFNSQGDAEKADQERERAVTIARYVKSGFMTNRRMRDYVGSLLSDSPRLFHLVGQELKTMKPVDPVRRLTATAQKMLMAAVSLLHIRKKTSFSVAQWQERYRQMHPGLPVPGESSFRFFANAHGIRLDGTPGRPIGRKDDPHCDRQQRKTRRT